MKYIRTKDGIYSLEKATICRYKNKEYVCPIRREETFEEHRSREHQFIGLKWEVIKIADTIEELCDEFVRSYKGYCRLLSLCNENPKKIFLEYSKYKMPEKVEIYGAIWTGWGLKYVAKMNDKGELELL